MFFERIHRIGQQRPVIVKRFIIKDSIEERIIKNRRALAADRPDISTQLDGAGIMESEDKMLCNEGSARNQNRQEDTNEMESKAFQRLQQLEALYGCSPLARVVKA